LKTHGVEEESERLICEIYTKTKFYKIYVLTVDKHTIKDQKTWREVGDSSQSFSIFLYSSIE